LERFQSKLIKIQSLADFQPMEIEIENDFCLPMEIANGNQKNLGQSFF
jgi:hypothetical protein